MVQFVFFFKDHFHFLICLCLPFHFSCSQEDTNPIPLPTYLGKSSSLLCANFFITASLYSIFLVREGVAVGEDIGGQVKSSLQWVEGLVTYPNFLLSPAPNDLSQNVINWSLRPPGAALLPVPGMLIGLSLGDSIQFALFICSIAGGIGWLYLFKNQEFLNKFS